MTVTKIDPLQDTIKKPLAFQQGTCRPRLAASARATRNGVQAASTTDRCTHSRRRTVLAGSLLLFTGQGAYAAGIESIPLPEGGSSKYEEVRRKNKEILDKSTEAFENSDILRSLREKSDANRSKNKRALQDRYCLRQAELGVGDCGGLRLIPGATKSGKQKTPEWLKGVLKKLGQLPPEEAQSSVAPAAATVSED